MEKIDYSDIVLQVLDDDSCNNLERSDQRNLKIPRGKRILVLNKIDKLTKSQLSLVINKFQKFLKILNWFMYLQRRIQILIFLKML